MRYGCTALLGSTIQPSYTHDRIHICFNSKQTKLPLFLLLLQATAQYGKAKDSILHSPLFPYALIKTEFLVHCSIFTMVTFKLLLTSLVLLILLYSGVALVDRIFYQISDSNPQSFLDLKELARLAVASKARFKEGF